MSSPSLLEDSVVRRPPVELLYEGGAGRSGPGVNLPERGEVRPGDQVVSTSVSRTVPRSYYASNLTGICMPELVLYGIKAPIIGPFPAWKPTILMP